MSVLMIVEEIPTSENFYEWTDRWTHHAVLTTTVVLPKGSAPVSSDELTTRLFIESPREAKTIVGRSLLKVENRYDR